LISCEKGNVPAGLSKQIKCAQKTGVRSESFSVSRKGRSIPENPRHPLHRVRTDVVGGNRGLNPNPHKNPAPN